MQPQPQVNRDNINSLTIWSETKSSQRPQNDCKFKTNCTTKCWKLCWKF